MTQRSQPRLFAAVMVPLILIAGACSVSQEQEVEMGKADAAKVDSQVPIIHDTMVERYITDVGKSMASKTSRANLDWHFEVVNSPEVNAFALPGGYIFVNRGAIEQADRFDQLAGIMGHEIGHVVKRHSVEQLKKQERGQFGIILLCTLTTACRHIGGQIAIDVGAHAASAHYSQKDEAQADSEGVLNTLRAGIDPEGLPSFFQKLLDDQQAHPTLVEAFFSTHPTDQSRVAATRKEIAEIPQARDPNLVKDTPEFHAIQAHVRELPPPPTPQAPTP